MNFKEAMLQLSEKVSTHKHDCRNEEATKTALILPFISALGYDTFNPREVSPEVDCDIRGTGDKVDYVIKDGTFPLILIECKYWRKNLDNHVDQLAYYFASSEARFGILTNGVEYRFYSDTCRTNLMDHEPFLVVDIENLDDVVLEGLEMFCKEQFEVHRVFNVAKTMITDKKLREAVETELTNPSHDLIRHFAKLVFGRTPVVRERERFANRLKRTIDEYIIERGVYLQSFDNLIVTTPPRLEGDNTDYQKLAGADKQEVLTIVQNILNGMVQPSRISVFAGNSYSVLRLDSSVWYPILKFKWTESTKWVSVGRYNPTTCHYYCSPQKDKHYLESIQDINNLAKDIRDIVTVMLTSVAGETDEKRVEWVLEHRPDWNE